MFEKPIIEFCIDICYRLYVQYIIYIQMYRYKYGIVYEPDHQSQRSEINSPRKCTLISTLIPSGKHPRRHGGSGIGPSFAPAGNDERSLKMNKYYRLIMKQSSPFAPFDS